MQKAMEIRFVNANEILIIEDKLFLTLGTCVSTLLCGIDENERIFLGANHLVYVNKGVPEKNPESQIKKIIEQIKIKAGKSSLKKIFCLGVFGGGVISQDNKIIAENNVKETMVVLHQNKLIPLLQVVGKRISGQVLIHEGIIYLDIKEVGSNEQLLKTNIIPAQI